jgi:hypothetical protein
MLPSCMHPLPLVAGPDNKRRIPLPPPPHCALALSAGANSSGFVEHLLKSGRPLVDPVAEDGIGHHGNIRGPGYYH